MTSQESQNSVSTSDTNHPQQQAESLGANNQQLADSGDSSQNGNQPLVKKVRVARKLTQAERDAKNLNVS
jgi:hypothetical protein